MHYWSIKKIKIGVLVLIILIPMLLLSCTSGPKYTYEEYKKIKAIDADKDGENIDEDHFEDDNSDKLQSFTNDLNDYYQYIDGFKSIYDKHIAELFILFDDFDNEKEDIDKKNQYADSIIEQEEVWVSDLGELAAPDLLYDYHTIFIDYLNSEILFYKYFLEADLEKADSAAIEADDLRDRSFEELDAAEKDFNDRAVELSLEPPF